MEKAESYCHKKKTKKSTYLWDSKYTKLAQSGTLKVGVEWQTLELDSLFETQILFLQHILLLEYSPTIKE